MKVESFRVVPVLPERLAGLRELAYNVLWSWDEEIRAVFTRIDLALWNETDKNPVLMLGRISQQRLEELALIIIQVPLGFFLKQAQNLDCMVGQHQVALARARARVGDLAEVHEGGAAQAHQEGHEADGQVVGGALGLGHGTLGGFSSMEF